MSRKPQPTSTNVATERLTVTRNGETWWQGPIGVFTARFPESIDAAALQALEAGQEIEPKPGWRLRLQATGAIPG